MSRDGLKVEILDGVMFLTLVSPPLNVLTPSVRSGLSAALEHRARDCQGIVLHAQGRNFSVATPDVADSDDRDLGQLCRLVEDSPVPVVAVLQGLTGGAGAELALAARARIANPRLRLSFGDVSLGLCPQGGSARRLPRLIGAGPALDLLLSGRTVSAAEALSLGLVDGIAELAPLPSAARLAKALGEGSLLQRPPPDPLVWQSAVVAARKSRAGRGTAAVRIIDCVEAALILPKEAELDFEIAARADLAANEEAQALRAAAIAERRALSFPPVLSRLRSLSVDKVALEGVAPDLARVAVVALSREMDVHWSFPGPEAERAGLALVDSGIREGIRSGRLDMARGKAMRQRLTVVTGGFDATTTPFLVRDTAADEAGPAEALPGAARLVLGGQDGAMGLALSQAGRVCELTLPDETLPLARVTALAGLRRIGLLPVQAGNRPLIGARMSDASRTAVAWMIAHGVPRRQITAVLAEFGVTLPDRISIEAPSVLRAMPAAEVLNRWLAALANEGARLLDEGIARRPGDVDHLMVAGYGFPRWRGGPMHQADRRGLLALRHDLRLWGAEASLWLPSPLIDRLIVRASGFAALDG